MLPLPVKQIAKILGCNLSSLKIITKVSIDSRTINLGDLFFALEGNKNNGHHYLEQVSKQGAYAAVVNKSYKGPSFGLDLIFVDNTLTALQDLARYFVDLNKPKIIAITGSVGKTTTKDFVFTLIQEHFNAYKTPGNANSQIGLPLTILNLEKKFDVLVLEMGMSQEKDIQKLIEIAPPDIALISQIALVHAAFFDSIEGIAKAKSEIFTHKQTSTCIFNLDMPCVDIVYRSLKGKPISYSLKNPQADFFIKKSDDEIEVFEKGFQVIKTRWSILGNHNLENFLGAYVVARQLGLSDSELRMRIPYLKLPKKRFELIEKNDILFISDAYNASEKSMIAAFQSLPNPLKGCKKIAVLGDMKELGKFSKEMHENVAIEALKHIDILICLGKDAFVMHEIWQANNRISEFFENKDLLVEKLKVFVQKGDVVLLKGSRAHELDLIVEAF